MRGRIAFLLGTALGGAGALVASDSLVSEVGRVSDAEAQLTYARLLSYKQATWREAMAAYERILRDDPSNSLALAELTDISLRLGELPAAEQRFRAALARKPDDAASLVALAKLCLWSNRPAEAEQLL